MASRLQLRVSMGATIDTGGGGKKSVNVELNIVPYIDLMSCLTAFLLVVAVWVNLAQITIQPKGKARGGEPPIDLRPKVSVLLQHDTMYIGVANMVIDPIVWKRQPGADFDWAGLEAALVVLKKESELAEREDIEIAAESTATAPLTYDHVIHAMDVAVKVGFTAVELTEPTSLSWRPTL
jgi:biopolymer transport protein ExbD